MALILVAGCDEGGIRSAATELPAIQEAVVIHELPLDGTVDRAHAVLLPRSIELPRDPSAFDHSRLLGDGTLNRLELEDGATLVRSARPRALVSPYDRTRQGKRRQVVAADIRFRLRHFAPGTRPGTRSR